MKALDCINYLAYGLIALGVFLLVFSILKIRIAFPYILAVLILAIGLIVQYNINKTVQVRDICFHKGNAIQAEVIDHTRTMFILKPNRKTFFSSPRRHYSIRVEYEDGNGKIRRKTLHHKSETIWKKNPVGSKIIGLVYKDDSFFGEEMGGTFYFFNE